MKANLKSIYPILLAFVFLLAAGCSNNNSNYDAKYRSCVSLLASSIDMSTVGINHFADIWRTAIEKKTYKGKWIGSDFNEALRLAMHEADSIGIFSTINEVQNKIDSAVVSLKSPPKDYEQLYSDVLECYTISSDLIDMSKSPKGSLLSYSQRKDELTNRFVSKMREIDIKLKSKE
ncbi:hypothetical protein [Parapedobacter indicus]|uniref:Lipoprotein n=1 Tax=Parapedobacter indicus TaxID=1477437 RepID=A0A1I3UWS8_9SPHI|nr:hypothetical protein [Parapedobacter indicus]PPK99042.1 hypothetical protein CLV26_11573 [Parapedobacter indicus]SFJ87834.1 hypothetical protein SAMN05444682_115105 [Parapedobacter indicus]